MNVNPAQALAECERAEQYAIKMENWCVIIERYMAETDIPNLLNAMAAMQIERTKYEAFGIVQNAQAVRAAIRAAQSQIVVPGMKN